MTDLHVGATRQELVPGDPGALETLAVRLDALASGLAQAAAEVRLVRSGDWIGPAADAFTDVIELEPAGYETAAAAFGAVGSAVRRFAGVLEAAQAAARRAIDLYEEAAALTDRWTGAHRAYDAARRSAERGDPSALQRLEGLAPPPVADPGEAGRFRAEAMLAEARALVREAGLVAADVASDASAGAPDAPSLTGRVAGAIGHQVSEFAGGVWESTRDMGEFVWRHSNLRFVVDHDGYVDDTHELAAAIWYGIDHPSAALRVTSDAHTWTESPARAMGHMVPDAALGAATAGAGAAGTVARRLVVLGGAATRLVDESEESRLRLRVAADDSVDVFTITPEPVWRTTDEPLYRADDREPATVFSEGLLPREPTDTDLALYVLTGGASAFVSTTRDSGLIHRYPHEFQYEIDAPGGIDVNATIGPHPFADEQEVAFPGGIESCHIEGARPYDDDTGRLGPFEPNPVYDPDCDD
jgi:hypothetical protein